MTQCPKVYSFNYFEEFFLAQGHHWQIWDEKKKLVFLVLSGLLANQDGASHTICVLILKHQLI